MASVPAGLSWASVPDDRNTSVVFQPSLDKTISVEELSKDPLSLTSNPDKYWTTLVRIKQIKKGFSLCLCHCQHSFGNSGLIMMMILLPHFLLVPRPIQSIFYSAMSIKSCTTLCIWKKVLLLPQKVPSNDIFFSVKSGYHGVINLWNNIDLLKIF